MRSLYDNGWPKFYKLENKIPIPCSDQEWGKLLEGNRHVRLTHLNAYNAYVSTVFIGLDHNHFRHEDSEPHIFETMIFCNDKDYNNNSWRCGTWNKAVKNHHEVVRMLIKLIRNKELIIGTKCDDSSTC